MAVHPGQLLSILRTNRPTRSSISPRSARLCPTAWRFSSRTETIDSSLEVENRASKFKPDILGFFVKNTDVLLGHTLHKDKIFRYNNKSIYVYSLSILVFFEGLEGTSDESLLSQFVWRESIVF